MQREFKCLKLLGMALDKESKLEMAHPEGFEPPTPRFVVWYSIQLNYGCISRGHLIDDLQNVGKRKSRSGRIFLTLAYAIPQIVRKYLNICSKILR